MVQQQQQAQLEQIRVLALQLVLVPLQRVLQARLVAAPCSASSATRPLGAAPCWAPGLQAGPRLAALMLPMMPGRTPRQAVLQQSRPLAACLAPWR